MDVNGTESDKPFPDDAGKDTKEKVISLTHIESKPSKRLPGSYEFLVSNTTPSSVLQEAMISLKDRVTYHQVLSKSNGSTDSAPWFPRKISELDELAYRNLNAIPDPDSDHPGFTDPEYRRRRNEIADTAYSYHQGEPIPMVTYTKSEIQMWNTVYSQVTSLHKTHVCQEYMDNFNLLVKHCGYGPDNIPQLEDVSKFLKDRSGFTMRPGGGNLTPRNYFAGLAFRVAHGTQYLRHPDRPAYTPEPDVCHELLGHVPFYADPKFADFAQEIGLLSLGASDEQITLLSNCFWFTFEYGLCRENGQVKIYGASLLSALGEMENAFSDEPEIRSFDPEKASTTDYPLWNLQPVYYLAESFEDAQDKFRTWAKRIIQKPFGVRYNPYTQSVEVL